MASATATCPYCGRGFNGFGADRGYDPQGTAQRSAAGQLGAHIAGCKNNPARVAKEIAATGAKAEKKAARAQRNQASAQGSSPGGTASLLALVAVGLLIAWYVATFSGDFEAQDDRVVFRAEASSSSPRCGEAVHAGDNLSCGDECVLADGPDGRWVQVRTGQGPCWASYADVTFQHGLVMSVLGLVVPLRTTKETNRRALAAYTERITNRVADLKRKNNYGELAALARSLRKTQLSLAPSAVAALDAAARRSECETHLGTARALSAPTPSLYVAIMDAQNSCAASTMPELKKLKDALDVKTVADIAAEIRRAQSSSRLTTEEIRLVLTLCDLAGAKADTQGVLEALVGRLEKVSSGRATMMINASDALLASTCPLDEPQEAPLKGRLGTLKTKASKTSPHSLALSQVGAKDMAR